MKSLVKSFSLSFLQSLCYIPFQRFYQLFFSNMPKTTTSKVNYMVLFK